MKSIDKITNYEYIINKSRFITYLIPINNIDEVNKNIENIKKEYKDATHYCYAYILDNVKRFSDDGEPGGTAGMPILNVLEQNELNHILCIVIRYFGGIKLGAGGLVRAYTNSVANAINKCNIINLINGNIVELTFNYNEEKKINKLIEPYDVIEKKYDNEIKYILFLPNNYNLDNINYKILKENILGQEKKV